MLYMKRGSMSVHRDKGHQRESGDGIKGAYTQTIGNLSYKDKNMI